MKMESAQKSFEIQAKVRQNAEEFKNTLNDLYNWEKEIKEKDQKLKSQPGGLAVIDDVKTLPIRSQVSAAETLADKTREKNQPKQDISPVQDEEHHKRANERKDSGNKYVKLGDYEKAMTDYTAAIDIYPEAAVYYTNRALCYLKLERYTDCIDDCERAIDLDNLSVKAYYRRMQANEHLGNYLDALKDCTTVLTMEPKNGDAKRSLERINARLRCNTKAANSPNFSTARSDLIDILPIEKPPYKRSSVPLRRVFIADIVGPKDTKNYENSELQISDEDIDKLFNSNCGSFVEIKNKKHSIEPSIDATAKGRTEEMKNDNSTITKAEVTANPSTSKPTAAPRPLPLEPTSSAQFYLNWKELTAQQKCQYLQSIAVSNLCKILGAGFDSDTLTDILHTLSENYSPHKDSTLAATLLEISKNDQVPILSLLMSSAERQGLLDLLGAIKNDADAVTVNQIAKNFNLEI